MKLNVLAPITFALLSSCAAESTQNQEQSDVQFLKFAKGTINGRTYGGMLCSNKKAPSSPLYYPTSLAMENEDLSYKYTGTQFKLKGFFQNQKTLDIDFKISKQSFDNGEFLRLLKEPTRELTPEEKEGHLIAIHHGVEIDGLESVPGGLDIHKLQLKLSYRSTKENCIVYKTKIPNELIDANLEPSLETELTLMNEPCTKGEPLNKNDWKISIDFSSKVPTTQAMPESIDMRIECINPNSEQNENPESESL